MTRKRRRRGSEQQPPNSTSPPDAREVRPETPEKTWDEVAPPPPVQSEEVSPPNLDGMDFTPPPDQGSSSTTLAGHDVNEVTHEDLMRMQVEETGGTAVWGASMNPNEEAVQRANQARQQGVLEEEVDHLTPDWMKARQQVPPPQPTQTPAQRDLTQAAMPEVDMGDMKTAADTIRLLNQQAAQAESDGNIVGARALREAMESVASATEMKRKYEPQKVNPVLQKLKSSLGLEKIKPVRKEWAGLFWNCYASNTVLDAWFFENLWDDRGNFAALKISTYCVGIDDVPLYKVFSIPLVHKHNVVGEDGTVREVTIRPYRKNCKMCGIEVQLEEKECKNCGVILDPFVVPLSLRLYCAEKLYTFFQEEFGPTEKLDTLVGLLRDVIKDRMVDSEELYPLAMLSVEAVTTDGLPSGEGPSPEQESSQPIQEQ